MPHPPAGSTLEAHHSAGTPSPEGLRQGCAGRQNRLHTLRIVQVTQHVVDAGLENLHGLGEGRLKLPTRSALVNTTASIGAGCRISSGVRCFGRSLSHSQSQRLPILWLTPRARSPQCRWLRWRFLPLPLADGALMLPPSPARGDPDAPTA